MLSSKALRFVKSKKNLSKIFEIRTACFRDYSDSYDNFEDIFKFYSDKHISDGEGFKMSDDNYNKFMSTRSNLRVPAMTRQITSLAYKVGKEFLSLAEGMPPEEVFPISKMEFELKDGQKLVFQGRELATALQYVPSQGLPQLLSELRDLQQTLHKPPNWTSRDVLVTSGAQYGLYTCAEALLDHGDSVMMQEHSYPGMHVVLKPYQPEVLSLPEDEFGIIPSYLDKMLESRRLQGLRSPKFLYVVPTGGNPTGAVIPEDRRIEIYKLAGKYDFLIVEDDAYMFMNYTGEAVPSFLSLDVEGRVIRLDSLSKVISPGLRMGWVTAPIAVINALELHLMADHLHSCTIGQALTYRLLSKWSRQGLAKHLRAVKQQYLVRRDALQAALETHLTGLATWHVPQAGMFFWLKLNVDDVYDMVFKTAFERGIMLIPGQACAFDSGAPSQYLRLAFSRVPIEDMDRAASLLASVVREEMAKSELRRCATQR